MAETPRDDYSCEGCPYNDPDTEVCSCDGVVWEGLCWKEVEDGKVEIWQDSFGNLRAIPTDEPTLII